MSYGASLLAEKVTTVGKAAVHAMRGRPGDWLRSAGLREPSAPNKNAILGARGCARDTAQTRCTAAAKRHGVLAEDASDGARSVCIAALRVALESGVLRAIGLTARQVGG